MKAWIAPVMVIVVLMVIKSIGDIWLRANKADTERATLRAKCKTARVDFFGDCYKWHGRADCEALWAQTRGHVFDGEPTNQWVDEVDCSPEVK